MNRFQQGMLAGLFLSLGIILVLLLTRNQERRRQLTQRLEHLQHSAHQAVTKAREVGSTLSDQVQESAGNWSQRTQKVLSAVQQTVSGSADGHLEPAGKTSRSSG